MATALTSALFLPSLVLRARWGDNEDKVCVFTGVLHATVIIDSNPCATRLPPLLECRTL
jgi:hypothetical protein